MLKFIRIKILRPVAEVIYARFPSLYWWSRGKTHYLTWRLTEPEKAVRSDLADYIVSLKPKRVFEYGAGDADFMKQVYLRDNTIECHGLDFSPSQLAFGKKHFPEADLRLGDLSKLPYPDSFFDALLGHSVLMYLPPESRSKVFHEFFRCCRAGGEVVALEWIVNLLTPEQRERFNNATDYRYSYDIEQCLRLAGFEILDVRKDKHSWTPELLNSGALPLGIIVARKP